jgi:hypothetical protein
MFTSQRVNMAAVVFHLVLYVRCHVVMVTKQRRKQRLSFMLARLVAQIISRETVTRRWTKCGASVLKVLWRSIEVLLEAEGKLFGDVDRVLNRLELILILCTPPVRFILTVFV